MWLGVCVGRYLVFAVASEAMHRRRLRQRDEGWSRDRFVSEFVTKGIDQSVSGTVYDFYQKDAGVGTYRVSPIDDLEKDYGKTHDDVDEDATPILKTCSLELPPSTFCVSGLNLSEPLRTWSFG